jgi:arylsulfatase A-like enzyme/Flp pilus assembly protein TadD
MTRVRLALIVGGPVLAVAIGSWVMRRLPADRPQKLPHAALAGSNVLLVTIDTLRADHVGAYGSDGALTPTIDQFAQEGLVFDRTYAHVPLTLPSHASLMTARYPTRTGVHDNGTFRLAADVPTLATTLRAAGYRTGAFVGAFVLDARFGLNQGFDVYDDRMLGSSADLNVVQRTADQVLAPAYDWIVARRSPESQASPAPPASSPGTPWFCWVHLYDPHEPYTPPEPYRSRFAGEPYDGEVAYADGALGLFVGRLRAAGVLDRTLVVITSDHGESLGEHGERTHGLFAYDATLRVPLVMWAAGRIRPGTFSRTMRLVDVAPTVIDLVGAPAMADVDGRSIRPFVAGEQRFEDPGSYFEALDANLTRHWAPLTGIVRQQTKLIDLPIPELYDLSADPGERTNLYARQRERARDLERRLDLVTRGAAASSPSAIDADAEARLRALGYVVAAAAPIERKYTAADDPKRLVGLNQALDAASEAWSRGDAAAAIGRLQQAVAERPDFTVAYDRLAYMLQATGRAGDAMALLDRAARAGYADRPLLRLLGETARDAGALERSATVLQELVRTDPDDLEAADALAQTYARQGRGRDAEALFTRVLAQSPNAAATWTNLGALYLAENRNDQAKNALERAVAINPDLATAHNALGVVHARAGDLDAAAAEWHRTLSLRPGDPDATSNLQRIGR